MPRIRKEMGNIPFFLFGTNPTTGEMSVGGTGFVVSLPANDGNNTHYYAITNWHVAVRRGYSQIRLNQVGGRARLLEFEPNEWQFLPNSDDLAAIDITDEINPSTDIVAAVPHDKFVTKDFLRTFNVGFGEEVFMIGLLHNHPGQHRNLPVARFGALGRLADDDSPVKLSTGAARPSHIVDMRSRTGFSGSPVFAYCTPNGDISDLSISQQHIGASNWWVALLGVHCGQFHEEAGLSKVEQVGDPILDGDVVSTPSGMNVVVPAWQITHLLRTSEKLIAVRDERDRRR